ncbi:MAG: hypothetical protein LKF53_02650 [Solobacterium sp.]|jgi:hypothetical protein|nr:hypothetical protein [Solobacterium sp.]MCH4205278.1 hypothetical protein [Solobacterium sp.]MCH4226871.1 hypothetical protein [Solobacterium sp.]MCH4281631.1 hypothetical protein [Solobacterium sp.]
MDPFFQTLAIALVTAMTSSGVTGLLVFMIQRHDSKHDLLMGLGHDRIYALATEYIRRGYVTREEYENINEYIYKPYRKRGGNGTGEKLMKEVEKLPMKEE